MAYKTYLDFCQVHRIFWLLLVVSVIYKVPKPLNFLFAIFFLITDREMDTTNCLTSHCACTNGLIMSIMYSKPQCDRQIILITALASRSNYSQVTLSISFVQLQIEMATDRL